MAPLVLLLLAILPAVLGQYDSNCPMLLESELGDTTTPVNTGFLAVALSAASGDDTLVVQLLDEFNIVCLAQGAVRDTYRSLSLIATYRDGGGTEDVAQLHLQCVGGSWSTDNFGSTGTAASNPSTGNLTTTLRRDCIICANPLQLGGQESAEHCVECDAGCVGLERCTGTAINDQTCCNYFGVAGSCVTACPTDSTPNAQFLCECDEGFEVSESTCVSTCQPNPCQNGGTCTAMGDTFSCSCPDNSKGSLCSECSDGFSLSSGNCVRKETDGISPTTIGIIIGVVLGAVVLIVIGIVVALIIFFVMKKKK